MTVRRRVTVLVLVAVAMLAGAAALRLFEQVPVEVRRGASPEARANPWLAMQRFLERGPQPLRIADDSRVIETLAAGDALLLDIQTVPLSRSRQELLLAWVTRGGYLVLMVDEDSLDDRWLFRQVGIEPCKWRDDEDDGAFVCAGFDPLTGYVPSDEDGSPTSRVRLPGWPRPLIVADVGSIGVTRPVAWAGKTSGVGPSLVHLAYGGGQITVGTGLTSAWRNTGIGRDDHAPLLAGLIDTYARHGTVVLLTRSLDDSGRLAALWPAAWPFVSGLGLVVVVLVWAAWPRFGAVRTSPPRARRQLAEHLDAVSRYVADAGGDDIWLDEVRRHVGERLRRRHPSIASLPAGERVVAVAHLSRLPDAAVAEALVGPAQSADDFVTRMRHLHAIEQHL